MSSLAPIVTGVLVGAASGIGGTALGAWMNGKSQLAALGVSIRAEDNRIKLADKRQLYARLIVEANETILAIYHYSRPGNKSDSQMESERAKLLAAYSSMAQAINEIFLIAPPDVYDAANGFFSYIAKHYTSAYNGTREINLPDKDTKDLAQKVYVVMRKDLDSD
jgi:hypothetical protein